MSEALTRVIEEQQATVDALRKQLDSAHETLNTMWTQHEELFGYFARLLDAPPPGHDVAYNKLRHQCRLQMLEAGYCMTCYNFICECDGQYD